MATELAGIRRAIRNPGSRGITLHVTGIGRAPTVAGLSPVIAAAPGALLPGALLMVGFCGGADPELRAGDLHVAGSFHAGDSTHPEPIAADAGLVSQIAAAARTAAPRVSTAPSATVAALAGPDAKSAVHSSLGAASVNMEDYWAAATARAAGVPFASIRAVLDTADADLPTWLRPADHPSRVARGLLVHPERAPALLRLARTARIARRSLTQCVLAVLAALPATAPPLVEVA